MLPCATRALTRAQPHGAVIGIECFGARARRRPLRVHSFMQVARGYRVGLHRIWYYAAAAAAAPCCHAWYRAGALTRGAWAGPVPADHCSRRPMALPPRCKRGHCRGAILRDRPAAMSARTHALTPLCVLTARCEGEDRDLTNPQNQSVNQLWVQVRSGPAQCHQLSTARLAVVARQLSGTAVTCCERTVLREPRDCATRTSAPCRSVRCGAAGGAGSARGCDRHGCTREI